MKGLFLFFLLTLSIGFGSVKAQTDQSPGNWNVFVVKGKMAEKYFYNVEFNFRKTTFNPIYDYSEYKILFGRTLNKNISVDVGTGGYNSSLTGTFLTTQPSRKEIRTWFDFLLKNSYKRLNFDQRIRLERRFNIWSGTPFRYRYRPLLSIPINHSKIIPHTLYFQTSDDLFFGTGIHWLELNMFYVGGGYKLNDWITVNAGNMDNYDFRKTTGQNRNYLYLTFIFDLGPHPHASTATGSEMISHK